MAAQQQRLGRFAGRVDDGALAIGKIVLSDSVTWPVPHGLAGHPDGTYQVGIRPHLLTAKPNAGVTIEISGRVLITELSGSESVIHFTHDDLNWVTRPSCKVAVWPLNNSASVGSLVA